jgi:hypothetical protein
MVSLLYSSAPDFEFALGGPAEGTGLLELDEAEPLDLALWETEGLGAGVSADLEEFAGAVWELDGGLVPEGVVGEVGADGEVDAVDLDFVAEVHLEPEVLALVGSPGEEEGAVAGDRMNMSPFLPGFPATTSEKHENPLVPPRLSGYSRIGGLVPPGRKVAGVEKGKLGLERTRLK